MTRALAILLAATLCAGCSDDNATPDGPVADRGAEAGLDGALDQASDSGPREGGAGDAAQDAPIDGAREASASDGSVDAGKKDAALKDGPPQDAGFPTVWGYVSRSAVPVLDAKGEVYIGLFSALFPPPLFPVASTVLKGAHLAQTTTKIKYTLYNVPSGTYQLYAFLDDNSNVVAFPGPMPDAPDLAMSSTKTVTVAAGTAQQVDIVLNTVQGTGYDGGTTSLGALKGTITTSATPTLDGKGTIYVSLHTQVPPAGQVAGTSMNNTDLSSPYAQELYYLAGLQPGSYYLRVFLDDNGNANVFAPTPDKGDLIHSKNLQVHVVGGALGVHDVILDQVKP